MNRTLKRCIVRFLSGSRPTGDGAGTLGLYNLRDWDQAMDWLHRSGLALHFWQRVKDSNLHEALTESLRARLERNFRDNQARVASMAEEFQLLNRQFQSAGIDFAVIKGFALVPEYCPQAALRMQFDHDYFLRPDSLRQAEEVLRACGYIPKPSRHEVHPLVYVHSLRAPRFPVDWDGFYSPQLYRSVELHIRLWEAEREKIRIMLP
ncbi:MAG: nucleotidyltransferase family protein, partial [Acidobacteria bacterium]|nr:nucleotidyltransferase family protein [Acidobacteriota bacterium]